MKHPDQEIAAFRVAGVWPCYLERCNVRQTPDGPQMATGLTAKGMKWAKTGDVPAEWSALGSELEAIPFDELQRELMALRARRKHSSIGPAIAALNSIAGTLARKIRFRRF
jgi:hypothetical protein